MAGPVIGFDTETRGLNWFDPAQRAFMASWADDQGEYTADLTTSEGVAAYRQVLDEAHTLIAHNLKFDTHQTRETIDVDLFDGSKQLHDTDTMSRILNPLGNGAGGHGLKELSQHVLKVDDLVNAEAHMFELAKGMKLKMKETDGYYDFWRAYPEIMEKYARWDARGTYDLFHALDAQMDARDRRIYELERAVTPVLLRAEQRGTRIDPTPVGRLLREYKAEQARLHDYLSTELGDTALGGEGSQEALIEALQMIGVPLTERTDEGKLATNKFALQPFEDEFPQIGALFDFRRVNKFLKTYIEPMVGREFVHPSFRQIGAWTGRMSCGSPNMQNIPKAAGKEVREMFIPRDGYCFVVVDYEQIEFRLLARWLADEGLIQLMEEGHDPFAWLAASILGGEMSYYVKGAEGEPFRKDYKNVTYAICYGAGKPRVTNMLGLDPGPIGKDGKPKYTEAAKVIAQVKGTLPGYYRLNERIKKKVGAMGHVNTMWGRTQLVNKDKAYVGLDALIQGTAADIMKQGCINVSELLKPLDGHILLVVHDELVCEVPLEYAEQGLALTEQGMCEAADIRPGLAVEGAIVTTNYADA